MVFAAGLLADAVENMQELGWLPFLGPHLWNTSSFLSRESAPSGMSSTACSATPTIRPCSRSSSGSPTSAVATTAFIVRAGVAGRRRPGPGCHARSATSADRPAGGGQPGSVPRNVPAATVAGPGPGGPTRR